MRSHRWGFVLALASTSVVAAGPVLAQGKKATLLATGNTIAGPGRVTIDPGGQTLVLRQSDQTPLDLCVTAVHVGPPGTVVSAQVKDPGSVANSSSVERPGDAVSVCRAASNEVTILCISPGSPCAALWRVDQPR
jgi:hypothetical protein